jgi:hypothetical protein
MIDVNIHYFGILNKQAKVFISIRANILAKSHGILSGNILP